MDLPSGIAQEDIVGYECKHAIYTQANDGSREDLLTIKENIHLKDGRIVPHVRFIKNYKREFWITREGLRNHHDKKEFEDLNKLQSFKTTQCDLVGNIARALGRGMIQGGLRIAARSPYLYGCDITTPVLVKHRYMTQYPNCATLNSVAVLDIESSMLDADGKPIMASLTFRDRAIFVVARDFIKGTPNPEEKIREKFTEYLGEYEKARNINLEIYICEKISEGFVKLFKKAHEWMPDFITIWNINYDLPKIVEMLTRDGFDPADVLSDPNVPVKFRKFRYREGPSVKITASGKSMTLSPAERWHTVECPSSFYFIDSMCVYQKIRIAKGKEPGGYGLDNILQRYLGIRKLKFKEADGYEGVAWHIFMQRNFPIEYCVYNLFDCISVELLDEEIKDLRQTISFLSGASEYSRFNSQPKRTCDDLHFFFMNEGKVIATTSDEMIEENDSNVIGINSWIVALPAHLVAENGLQIIEEMPELHTNIRAHVADLDIAGTYPTLEKVANISRDTTKRELSTIDGVSEETRRIQGINFTGGHTNAVEFCVEMYGAPSFKQALDAFQNKMKVIA